MHVLAYLHFMQGILPASLHSRTPPAWAIDHVFVVCFDQGMSHTLSSTITCNSTGRALGAICVDDPKHTTFLARSTSSITSSASPVSRSTSWLILVLLLRLSFPRSLSRPRRPTLATSTGMKRSTLSVGKVDHSSKTQRRHRSLSKSCRQALSQRS